MSDRVGFRVTFRALAFAGLCSAALPVTAADWPTFAPGQWQIERSIEGMAPQAQKIQRTECMDPSADLAKQREMLGAAGCEFSELSGSGSTFRYTATCRMGGVTSVSESLLEVDGAEGFTITIDSDTGGMKTHEVMRATRLGDCPQ